MILKNFIQNNMHKSMQQILSYTNEYTYVSFLSSSKHIDLCTIQKQSHMLELIRAHRFWSNRFFIKHHRQAGFLMVKILHHSEKTIINCKNFRNFKVRFFEVSNLIVLKINESCSDDSQTISKIISDTNL